MALGPTFFREYLNVFVRIIYSRFFFHIYYISLKNYYYVNGDRTNYILAGDATEAGRGFLRAAVIPRDPPALLPALI